MCANDCLSLLARLAKQFDAKSPDTITLADANELFEQ
jgi:hypothetical protein